MAVFCPFSSLLVNTCFPLFPISWNLWWGRLCAAEWGTEDYSFWRNNIKILHLFSCWLYETLENKTREVQGSKIYMRSDGVSNVARHMVLGFEFDELNVLTLVTFRSLYSARFEQKLKTESKVFWLCCVTSDYVSFGHRHVSFLFFFSFIFISWRLITLQYCSEFCHTLIWISHGFTCVPHPDPPSHLPLHPITLGLPTAPALSTCLMHTTWAGDLFHPW